MYTFQPKPFKQTNKNMAYENFPNYADDTLAEKFYCTCGESSKKPYCGGSHESSDTKNHSLKLE